MNTVKPVSSDTTLHDHPVLSNHFPRSQIFQPFITISVTFTSIKWFSPVLNGHFGNIQINVYLPKSMLIVFFSKFLFTKWSIRALNGFFSWFYYDTPTLWNLFFGSIYTNTSLLLSILY